MKEKSQVWPLIQSWGAFSQDVDVGTGGYKGKVLEARENERWGQGRGCLKKYRVETKNQWGLLLR